MTPEEWNIIVEWYADRYSPYEPAEAVAIYTDVRHFDYDVVQGAVRTLHERGSKWPPNASVLYAACVAERRDRATGNRFRALPEDTGPPVSWSEYTRNRFGEELTVGEVIERLHAARSCKQERCEIHAAETKETNDE